MVKTFPLSSGVGTVYENSMLNFQPQILKSFLATFDSKLAKASDTFHSGFLKWPNFLQR